MSPQNQPTPDSRLTNRGFGLYLLQFIRIVVGVLFIFSGLVKANDPSGLAYKMQEFFEVWHMTWLTPFALGFSIIMIIFEIIAGVALLLGYAFRLFSILILLLMIFFTFLTGYAVLSGKVKECGCFGDCIPLEAMQSFIKDLILLALIIILFLARKHIRPIFQRYLGTSVMILSLFFSAFIQWYALAHLPFVDCLPYKKGNNIWEKMQPPPGSSPDVYQTTYAMKNLETGATKKISDKEYLDSGIWKDTTWAIEGEPVQELVKKGNAIPKIQDFHLSDYEGNDYTEPLLKEPGYNFLFFIKDVHKASIRNIDILRNLSEKCQKNNVGFFVLSASPQAATEAFLRANNIQAQTFSIDATVCKTAIRSNPGLMLIKAGTVKGKWSYNDYPTGFNWISAEQLKINN
jgi:uncharacterized membrane protein YphA (DoxX/SURF4 family)